MKKKIAAIFGGLRDGRALESAEDKVKRQVYEIQGKVPETAQSGSGLTSMLGGKAVKQHFGPGTDEVSKMERSSRETYEYRPTHTSDGGISSYESKADDFVNKAAVKKEKGSNGNVVELAVAHPEYNERKAPMQPKKLLKKSSQDILSHFVGGMLAGLDKHGYYPDVDPGLLFDTLISDDDIRKVAAVDECTSAEVSSVRQAFIDNWK